MEKLKTLTLAVLVAASLVQSYFLAYSTPKFEPLAQTDYVETELNGTQAKLEDLILPERVILHFGQKTHTVLVPSSGMYHYRNILDFLKKRTFDGLRKMSAYSASINWDDIRDNQQGIEIRFREGIPISVLQSLMTITREDNPVDNDLITRIWIHARSNRDEVKTYFISDSNVAVYEAVKADVTTKDVEEKVRLGESLVTYHTTDGSYYLPDKPIPAIRFQIPYTQYTSEQLKRSLFVDPGMARLLTERDGSQIITDGKRGLQIRNDQRWFSYSDPISAPVEGKSDVKDNMLAAIKFVNQHGGWNGTYTLFRMTPKQAYGPQMFLFREYLEGYPVMNLKQDAFGYIQLVVQKGTISNYERSLLAPEGNGVQKFEAAFAGGSELDQMVARYGKNDYIVNVFPGYRTVLQDKVVEFIPAWFVELRDGTFDVLS